MLEFNQAPRSSNKHEKRMNNHRSKGGNIYSQMGFGCNEEQASFLHFLASVLSSLSCWNGRFWCRKSPPFSAIVVLHWSSKLQALRCLPNSRFEALSPLYIPYSVLALIILIIFGHTKILMNKFGSKPWVKMREREGKATVFGSQKRENKRESEGKKRERVEEKKINKTFYLFTKQKHLHFLLFPK